MNNIWSFIYLKALSKGPLHCSLDKKTKQAKPHATTTLTDKGFGGPFLHSLTNHWSCLLRTELTVPFNRIWYDKAATRLFLYRQTKMISFYFNAEHKYCFFFAILSNKHLQPTITNYTSEVCRKIRLQKYG